MSVANFTIALGVTLGSAGLVPFKKVQNALDSVSQGVRRTFRSFRDLTIIFYGVRRGFDLLSRAVESTFSRAGVQGTQQLALLSKAVGNFGSDVGKTIQKSQAFQEVFGALIRAFAKGIDESSQTSIARGFDLVVAGILGTVADAMDTIGKLFQAIRREWDAWVAYFNAGRAKLGALALPQQANGGVGAFPSGARDMLDAGRENSPTSLWDRMAQEQGISLAPQSQPIYSPKSSEISMPPHPMQGMVDALRESAGKIKSKAGKGEDATGLDLIQKFQINAKNAIDTVQELGGAWSTVMSNFAEEAFDSSTGVTKAFKNLGKNARKAFVSQMSSAAFSPLTQSFNMLANALAMPFKIVGQFINDLFIEPVVMFIATTLKSLFSSIVGTAIATKAAGNGLQAASLAENLVTSQALLSMYAPAAVAAAIGSFGGANAAGAIAMGQIQAARIPLAAEGMVVMPRSGGTLVGVGEGGEPETILPLSKAKEMGFGGGGGLTIIVNGDLKSTSSNRRLARNLAKEVHREMTAGRYAGGSRRRV